MRSLAIPCVALLIAAALAGGACLPCLTASAASHDCCGGMNHCGKSGGGSPVHRDCAAPAADVYAMRPAVAHVSHSAPASCVASSCASALTAVAADRLFSFTEEYPSPPLYLRNSVLTL